MKIKNLWCGKLNACYNECLSLIASLSTMTKEERMGIYESYSWMFPKSKKPINLEDQIGPRQDYKAKFKEWFYLVGEWSLSPSHLGECCYSKYKDFYIKPKNEAKSCGNRYAQKVILALGMIGLFTKIKTNYSCGKHGIVYEVDINKWNGWATTLDEAMAIERFNVNKDIDWTPYNEWYGDKQYLSICSLSVKQDYITWAKNYIARTNDFNLFYSHAQDLCDALYKKLLPQSEVESYHKRKMKSTLTKKDKEKIVEFENKLYESAKCLFDLYTHNTYNTIRHKIDTFGGRYYTFMTQCPSGIRHNCLLLDNEEVGEIDISSAQPTFLGLFVKQNYGEHTPWLEHCLNGDFYEWVKKVTGSKAKRKTIKKYIMKFLYSCYKCNDKNPKYKTTKNPNECTRGYYPFEKKLKDYLMKHEPTIFKIIEDSKSNPTWVEDKKKWRNDISKHLVQMEVAYIKKCISLIPNHIKFYTIHDCICCKQSDTSYVKSLMEYTSMDMFGVKMKLKIE